MSFKKFIVDQLEFAIKNKDNLFINVNGKYYTPLTWGKDYIYCADEKDSNSCIAINLNKTKSINLEYRYN